MTGIRPWAFGFDHPEDLAFDRAGALWSGGELGQVYRFDEGAAAPSEIVRLGGETRGLAFGPGERLFICNHLLRKVFALNPDGGVSEIPTSVEGAELRVPNYAVVGPDGSVYVSDSGSFPEADGTIWRLDPHGGPAAIFHHGPFAYTNGLAIDAAGAWLYVIETTNDSICRVPLVEPNGEVEPVASGLERMPDGMAFDRDGGLWVATFAGDAIYRVDPGGRTELVAHDDRAVTLNRPANLAFGGPNFDELFVANLGSTFISVLEPGVEGQPLYGGLRGFGS